MAAQSAPPRTPSAHIAGKSSHAGHALNVSAPHVANRAPMWSCPSPPTLMSQILPGAATANAVRMSGIILTIVSDTPYLLPSVAARTSAYARSGLRPKIRSTTANTASANASSDRDRVSALIRADSTREAVAPTALTGARSIPSSGDPHGPVVDPVTG